jgi:hypothetical protein
MIASLKPTKKLVRNAPHQQYFCQDGGEVVGASTIAGVGKDPAPLMHWAAGLARKGISWNRHREEAADVGTIAHFLVQCHLEECEPDLGDYAQCDIDSAQGPYGRFVEFWEGNGFALLASELQSVSEKYRYGGTIDVLFRDDDGKLCLLDIKTSKRVYDEHLFQLSAYEQLAQEYYGEEVSKRAIVRIGRGDDGDFEVRWLGDMSKYFAVFQAQLNLYNAKQAL